ncbi:hypothetical protein C8F01DRAFT_1178846 [Mycena amicta]|nr:hypothetical protein C8F01DRAFT_1178846 [Mycena amicta]
MSAALSAVDNVLLHLGERPDRESVESVIPPTVDICVGTAFRLVLLLQLRVYKLHRRKRTVDDVWTSWTESVTNGNEIEQLDAEIIHAFDAFLFDHRTTQEIERVLWTSFSLTDDSSRRIRVVDFLSAECPAQLICHDLLMLSLDHTWKYGPREGSPLRSRLDELCTPRVLHCVDLISFTTFFGILVSWVMHPPYEPADLDLDGEIQRTGWREIVLVVLSASILCRPWNMFKIPALTLFTVFMVHLPSVPFAGGIGFDIILVCFACHAFQFHFPVAPSPLFLFKRGLPFSAFLVHNFYIVLTPILFFLPIFILITTWLSMALSETFFSDSVSSLIPTPIQTRTTVLYLFFLLVSVISYSLFIILAQGRSLTNTNGWDGYSAHVSHKARASFAKAVVAYTSPYTFPAPFNLLKVLILEIPSLFWVLLRHPRPTSAQAEKLLWKLTVCPVALPVAALFLLFPDRLLG